MKLEDGSVLRSSKVILTNGTFLRAVMHVGEKISEGGRVGEGAVHAIVEERKENGNYKEFDDFMKLVPERVLIILDEAYYEYAQGMNDYPDSMLYRYDNVITLRTFSKVYGLAGLRVGYSVSSQEIADYLNRVRQPFNVNSLALKAAEIALTDKEHLKNSLELNKKEKQNLYKFFQSSGYKYIETYANFICFDCKSNSRDLFNKLLKKGVIARSMEIYKMPSHVRVTIGLPEENSIFTEALLSHGAT